MEEDSSKRPDTVQGASFNDPASSVDGPPTATVEERSRWKVVDIGVKRSIWWTHFGAYERSLRRDLVICKLCRSKGSLGEVKAPGKDGSTSNIKRHMVRHEEAYKELQLRDARRSRPLEGSGAGSPSFNGLKLPSVKRGPDSEGHVKLKRTKHSSIGRTNGARSW
ncbi:unnamed protein product, partial [Discosporangium mesarthrocarpum]